MPFNLTVFYDHDWSYLKLTLPKLYGRVMLKGSRGPAVNIMNFRSDAIPFTGASKSVIPLFLSIDAAALPAYEALLQDVQHGRDLSLSTEFLYEDRDENCFLWDWIDNHRGFKINYDLHSYMAVAAAMQRAQGASLHTAPEISNCVGIGSREERAFLAHMLA